MQLCKFFVRIANCGPFVIGFSRDFIVVQDDKAFGNGQWTMMVSTSGTDFYHRIV